MNHCETCVYWPPSSLGGKPCPVCNPDDPTMSCYQERVDKELQNN